VADLLQLDFIRNALFAVFLCGLMGGIIGSYVVVNRMVFLSGGVAHASFGGIGLAYLLGTAVLPTTFVFAVMVSVFIGIMTMNNSEKMDTIIGITWSSGMALGIIFLELTPGYKGNLMGYLFGSILSVSGSDLFLMLFCTVVVIIIVTIFYRNLAIMSFDREFAAAKGIPVNFFHVLILLLLGVALVVMIRVSGLILVIALLSIPPAISAKFSKSFLAMITYSVIISLAAGYTGLFFSYLFSISSGASIIICMAFLYLLAGVWGKVARKAGIRV